MDGSFIKSSCIKSSCETRKLRLFGTATRVQRYPNFKMNQGTYTSNTPKVGERGGRGGLLRRSKSFTWTSVSSERRGHIYMYWLAFCRSAAQRPAPLMAGCKVTYSKQLSYFRNFKFKNVNFMFQWPPNHAYDQITPRLYELHLALSHVEHQTRQVSAGDKQQNVFYHYLVRASDDDAL